MMDIALPFSPIPVKRIAHFLAFHTWSYLETGPVLFGHRPLKDEGLF